MANAKGVWQPEKCHSCGVAVTPKAVLIWNGKEGRESGMICGACWHKGEGRDDG